MENRARRQVQKPGPSRKANVPIPTPNRNPKTGTSAICQTDIDANSLGDADRCGASRAVASPPTTRTDQMAPGTIPNHHPTEDNRTQRRNILQIIAGPRFGSGSPFLSPPMKPSPASAVRNCGKATGRGASQINGHRFRPPTQLAPHFCFAAISSIVMYLSLFVSIAPKLMDLAVSSS